VSLHLIVNWLNLVLTWQPVLLGQLLNIILFLICGLLAASQMLYLEQRFLSTDLDASSTLKYWQYLRGSFLDWIKLPRTVHRDQRYIFLWYWLAVSFNLTTWFTFLFLTNSSPIKIAAELFQFHFLNTMLTLAVLLLGNRIFTSLSNYGLIKCGLIISGFVVIFFLTAVNIQCISTMRNVITYFFLTMTMGLILVNFALIFNLIDGSQKPFEYDISRQLAQNNRHLANLFSLLKALWQLNLLMLTIVLFFGSGLGLVGKSGKAVNGLSNLIWFFCLGMVLYFAIFWLRRRMMHLTLPQIVHLNLKFGLPVLTASIIVWLLLL